MLLMLLGNSLARPAQVCVTVKLGKIYDKEPATYQKATDLIVILGKSLNPSLIISKS